MLSTASRQSDRVVTEPREEARRRRFGWIVLVACVAAGAVLRIRLALTNDGIYWPDEIFKGIEPAHRLVFGYGLVPWEFAEGAAHWTLPTLVAGVLKLVTLAGASAPSEYLPAVRVALSLVAVAAVYGTYRLARTAGADELPSACGAALLALAAPAVYFTPRALSENVSALPVVVGFALGMKRDASFRHLAAGASLLGLAVLLRLQTGIFVAGLVAILLVRRDWRRAAVALLVLAGWAFAYGLIDRLTWGGWFHSAAAYLRFNLVEDGATTFGTEPLWYYARVLWTSMGPAAAVVAVLALVAARRATGLLLVVAAFVLVHSLTPHKESRFILPALPLLCALAGIGLHVVRERVQWRAWTAITAVAVVTAAASVAGLHGLSARDIGQHQSFDQQASGLDFHQDLNRLLMAANRRPDLCGLKLETTPVVWSGGYSYLHRRVPLYGCDGPDRAAGRYNYVIAPAQTGGDTVASRTASR